MLTKQEIRQLQLKEWLEEVEKARRDLLKMQFDIRGGHSKEADKIRKLRVYIARLQTIKREMKDQTTADPGKKEETTEAEVKSAPKKKSPAKRVGSKKAIASKTPADKAKKD